MGPELALNQISRHSTSNLLLRITKMERNLTLFIKKKNVHPFYFYFLSWSRVVFLSGVQQSESVIYVYTYPFFFSFFSHTGHYKA